MKMFTRKIAVLITLVALIFGAASCVKKGPAGKPSNVDYYTCTMHPSVRSQDPKGKCPICGMGLVPVTKKGAAMHDHSSPGGKMPGMPMEAGATNVTETPGEFTVSVERKQQIGVTYTTIE